MLRHIKIFQILVLLVPWATVLFAQTKGTDTLYVSESDLLITQDTSLYEVIYAKQDTIREKVEIANYVKEQTKYPIISLGIGIEQSLAMKQSSALHKMDATTTFPIYLKVQRNKYNIRTGFVYQKNNYFFSKTEKIQKIFSSQITETIFVDTIYKEVNDIFVPEVINKEQINVTHDTSFVDSLSTSIGMYSYYTIPFLIGYSLYHNSFIYGISVGTCLSIYSKKSFNELSSIEPTISRIMNSYIVTASCGYTLHNNIVIEGLYSYCFKPNDFLNKQQINSIAFSLFYTF